MLMIFSANVDPLQVKELCLCLTQLNFGGSYISAQSLALFRVGYLVHVTVNAKIIRASLRCRAFVSFRSIAA